MIADCHVNIWSDAEVLPHRHTGTARVHEKDVPA